MNLHPTTLRNLSEEELERYNYLQGGQPAELYGRIEVLQGENEGLENNIGRLENQVEELEDEIEELKERLKKAEA